MLVADAVDTGLARQYIVALTTLDHVIARTPGNRVDADIADDIIIAAIARQRLP